MTTTDRAADAGTARSPGISYQDLLDADTHPVPAVLRLESPRYLGSEDVAVERYTSREWCFRRPSSSSSLPQSRLLHLHIIL